MRPWREAWERALYGPRGFYASASPGEHFRTSVHVGEVFHAALARLLGQVDERLGRPAVLDLVDVGAGRGELLTGVLAALPTGVRDRVRAVGVDVRPRPDELDAAIGWVRGVAPPAVPRVRGLLLAHEWLDDLPCEVVEVDAAGVRRTVLVAADGRESLGEPVDSATNAWLDRWWPITLPGARAEVGTPRDAALTDLATRLESGTLLVVDYGHLAAERTAGRYDGGTLTGYAHGRQVAPVPDGGCDLTAHVAVDAAAAAVGSAAVGSAAAGSAAAGSAAARLTRQRDALAALGVSGRLPPRGLPAGAYADALAAASQAAELRDPAGLGAFWWLRLDRS